MNEWIKRLLANLSDQSIHVPAVTEHGVTIPASDFEMPMMGGLKLKRMYSGVSDAIPRMLDPVIEGGDFLRKGHLPSYAENLARGANRREVLKGSLEEGADSMNKYLRGSKGDPNLWLEWLDDAAKRAAEGR